MDTCTHAEWDERRAVGTRLRAVRRLRRLRPDALHTGPSPLFIGLPLSLRFLCLSTQSSTSRAWTWLLQFPQLLLWLMVGARGTPWARRAAQVLRVDGRRGGNDAAGGCAVQDLQYQLRPMILLTTGRFCIPSCAFGRCRPTTTGNNTSDSPHPFLHVL